MGVVIEAADCTQSGSNTAQATWAVSVPNAGTGDLLIFRLLWDDSISTADAAEPTGQNGETLNELNATPVVGSPAGGNAIRTKVWWTKTTGAWTAGTITFTPTATEQWAATVVRVPAGEFDATTPIGAFGTRGSTVETDSSAASPAFSAGASDGGGTVLWFAGVDSAGLGAVDSGWTDIQNQDIGAIAQGTAVRTADVTNSESIASASWALTLADDWASIALIVRPAAAGGTTRGRPFGSRGAAFNGGRTFGGMLSMEAITTRGLNQWRRPLSLSR